MSDDERCPCGQPLHYLQLIDRRRVEALVAQLGATIAVATSAGTWAVPRHYIALHGLKASELPVLAERYGFARVP